MTKLETLVNDALIAKGVFLSKEAFDALVEAKVLREPDDHLLTIIRSQQETINQLIKDADKHD